VLAISDGAWALVGVVISALVAPTWLSYLKLRKTGRSVDQINHAVNHVADGEPPLIERVRRLEQENKSHREWERHVFELLARHLGVNIPDYDAKQ
jgi:hypothetical protein